MVTYLTLVTMLVFSGICYYAGYRAGTEVSPSEIRMIDPGDFMLDPVVPEGDDYE